jgi:hypothetical protein
MIVVMKWNDILLGKLDHSHAAKLCSLRHHVRTKGYRRRKYIVETGSG